jgi:hypothetical protein
VPCDGRACEWELWSEDRTTVDHVRVRVVNSTALWSDGQPCAVSTDCWWGVWARSVTETAQVALRGGRVEAPGVQAYSRLAVRRSGQQRGGKTGTCYELARSNFKE